METKNTNPTLRKGFDNEDPKPRSMLLVAYSPSRAMLESYFVVHNEMQVGRDDSCRVALNDDRISRNHFRVLDAGKKTFIEDLGSSNGTFVNGERIRDTTRLKNNSVINAGHTLLVYVEDADEIHYSHHGDLHGMTGRFHATCISRSLEESARSKLNLLLSGPSGTGKELAAQALSEIMGRPLTVQNAARFSSSEEAAASLFGVGPKVFSGVSDRAGYIERADGGILFLDEAHNLPRRLQKSLLRIIEDGVLVRIGETEEREVDIRFVLASNKKGKTNGLVKDLYNRLRVVDIPPLAQRRADIPELFTHLLDKAFDAQGISAPPAADLLRQAHYESLMLDGFEDANIRGLIGIADKIATRAATDASPAQAIADTARHIPRNPSSPPIPHASTPK